MVNNIKKTIMLWATMGMVSLSYAANHDISAFVFNSQHSYVYVGYSSATQLQFCPVLSGSQLGSCVVTGPTSFIRPSSLALAPKGDGLYVLDGGYHTLYRCAVSVDNGQVLACTETAFAYKDPQSIAIAPNGRYAYVAYESAGVGGISRCALTDKGLLTDCRAASLAVDQPSALTLNATGTQAYVLSIQTQMIWSCGIDQTTGLFQHCAGVSIAKSSHSKGRPILARNIYKTLDNLNNDSFVTSCSMNDDHDLAYVNQYPDGSSFRCLVNQNQADFKSCFAGGNALAYASTINLMLNHKNTRMYVFSDGWVNAMCSIDANEGVTSCVRIEGEVHLPLSDSLI